MLNRSLKRITTRTKGFVFWRQDIVSSLESQKTTDMAFKIVDRPYPIGEIVRRMVRIKKKCVNAIAHGDDHEHSLLRGEYKYFTGKVIDVRGASVADLIAFVQCCSFFKFFDSNSLDRVLEELQLKISTLQPLEVLALMTATSDLPSKSEGNVDLDAFRQQLETEDAIRDEVKAVMAGPEPKSGKDAKSTPSSSYTMSHADLSSFNTVGLKAANQGAMPHEIMNNKNFTDFRFRKLAVGSSVGGGISHVGATEGSDVAAENAALLDSTRTRAEHLYHQTLSASFFKDLCDQALLFMGESDAGAAAHGTECQYSIEEQLEMLATLPEEASQSIVMSLLDSLVGPLIYYHHQRSSPTSHPHKHLYEKGESLSQLYTAMPWHAVTVVKGLMLISLESQSSLSSAEFALQNQSMTEESSVEVDQDGNEYIGRGAHGVKRSIEYRRKLAKEALAERRERSESNALFIHRAISVLGAVVAKEAGKPFSPSSVIEMNNEDEHQGEDELLAFTRQCSDAIPSSDPRKLTRDFASQHSEFSGGFAGRGGGDLGQKRVQKRSHMLNPWEISSVGAALAHLHAASAPFVPSATKSLPFAISKALQRAYVAQLPQCDVVSLSLMFETCRPASEILKDFEDDHERDEEFFAAQKQFFTFLRAAEDRVLYHCPKMSLSEASGTLAAYLESYTAAGKVYNSLCDELATLDGEDQRELRLKLQKEVSIAKTRMLATALVVEELISVCSSHVSSINSGELSAPTTVTNLLAVIAEYIPTEPIALGELNAPSRFCSEGMYRRFPQLQKLIHNLGASIVGDCKAFSTDDVLVVLMASVRLGDKMLDAAVTACLQRLTRLVELEQYTIAEPSRFIAKKDLTDKESIVLTQTDRTIARRNLQRASTIGSVSDNDTLHNSRRFNLSAMQEQQMMYAAALVSRNKANELFMVLENICDHTERRKLSKEQQIVYTNEQSIPHGSSSEEKGFSGLRSKQVDFIQRMLMPALRKVSLQA